MTNVTRTIPSMRNLAILLSLQLLNCRPTGSEPEGAGGAPHEPGNEAGQAGQPQGEGGTPTGSGGSPDGQAGQAGDTGQAGSGQDPMGEGGAGQDPMGEGGSSGEGTGGTQTSGTGGSPEGEGGTGGSSQDPDVGPNGAIVTSLAAGYGFTCALTRAGDVKCWGENSYGSLGNGMEAGRSQVAVHVTSGVKAISGGDWHACAVKQDDTLVCWGFNEYQQLDPDTEVRGVTTPSPLLGWSGTVQSVGVGTNRHSCLIDDIGGIQCWGQNTYRQLGTVEPTTASGTPIAVPGLATGYKSVVAGEDHTCGLTTSGLVKCWGSNRFFQLGQADQDLVSADPIEIEGLAGVKKLGAGHRYTCALTDQGAIWCWGIGGQNGTSGANPVPQQVGGLVAGVRDFSSGDAHSCALMEAGGTLLCWGYNVNGQLGNQPEDTEINETSPSPVAAIGVEGVIAVVAGNTHTCAALAQGGVQCWGSGWASGAPQSTNQLIPNPIQGF